MFFAMSDRVSWVVQNLPLSACVCVFVLAGRGRLAAL